MKNLVSSLALVAVLSVSGLAHAADAAAPAEKAAEKAAAPVAAKAAVVKLSKKEVSAIVKDCKKANPTDKKAYKACVAEKKKAAKDAKTTAAAPVTAPANN